MSTSTTHPKTLPGEQHTPKPWRLVKAPAIGDGIVATVAARLKIVSAEGVTDEEMVPNGHLLAAAPALLEALKALSDVVQTWRETGSPDLGRMTQAHDAAVDALKQATA